MTEQYPADAAFAARMGNSAFARAYDVWLLVLTQRAAQIELAESDLSLHPPGRSRRRPRARNHTVPRTA